MPDVISVQFIGQSLHFGINLFAALACLSAAWLFLDAWVERRHLTEITKGGGFLLLAAGFLMNGATWGNPGLIGLIANLLKFAGYIGIITGNLIVPLQPRPKTTGYTPSPAWIPAAIIPPQVTTGLTSLLPIAAFTTSLVYWRIATRGLERHLKPLAVVFLTFTLSDSFAVSQLWSTSSNPLLQPFITVFGPFWILEHLAILVGSALLARWVWRYLTKRLLGQLFLTITSLTFAIVLTATTSVSALLLSSLQRDSLASLETTSKVLSYAVDSKTADTRTNAEVLASDPATIAATTAHDHTALTNITGSLLINKQLSEVIITDDAGRILSRASDPERSGDSLSNDPLVQRALNNATNSSFAAHSGALAPTLVITTASPIKQNGQIIGTALVSLALDNAFADGLKHKTGLDSAVYSGTIRAASTLTELDGVSRSIGTKETHAQVLDTTIKHGQISKGIFTIAGQPYLSVYLPLKNINNTVVGMLFVGQPQDVVLSSAKSAVGLTFIGASLALLVITIPVFALASQISRQLH